jgi:uncharacterized membrane protein YphA (DoxX/SURF4 family)
MSHASSIDDSIPPAPFPPSRKDPRRAPDQAPRAMLRPGLLEPPVRTAMRLAAGVVFLFLGSMKISVKTFEHLVLGTQGLDLASGPSGFGQFLAAAGVPLPELSAHLVVGVELLCGLGLILGAFVPLAQLLTRLFAVALSVDMTMAILLAGVRNLLGDPVLLQGVPAMYQVWRFPLEVTLLGCMLYFFVRPVLRPAPRFSGKLRLLTHPPSLLLERERKAA